MDAQVLPRLELGELLDSVPHGIAVVDRGGKIVAANQELSDLFGYASTELIGSQIETLVPSRLQGSHAGRRERFMARPLKRPMGVGLRLPARRKDGSEFEVEVSLGPVELAGELLVVSTVRDVTARNHVYESREAAREEAESANRAKNEFLSRLSHELRTPLNSMLGFGQLLLMDSLSAEQRDAVNHVLRAGRHLVELVNEVLDIARIEEGRLTLSLEPVAVGDVLSETLELIRPLAAEHGVCLDEVPEGSSLRVLADKQRLRQVLLNLLSNAVKFNRAGGRVSCSCRASDRRRLRISVSDTGRGIAQDQIGLLFTPFERLGAEQAGIEGTGLGLVLSRRLAEAMSGYLGVESVVGKGSTFWIELPLVTREGEGGAVLSNEGVAASMRLGAGHVLYIEDNPESFKLMQRFLARSPDVKLTLAIQGSVGLDLARERHPDLVLLDLHLPDLPGLEVLLRLRADPTTRDIPVVVTSADATPGQFECLAAAGANGYLTKPLDLSKLAEVIAKVLRSGTERSP